MPRSGEHYMPRPDGDFAAWANAYDEAVKKWWDANGLDANDLKPLETALAEWVKDYPAHVTAQAAAEGARQAKDAARGGLEKQVRPITNFIQTYLKTTDADRATMGITVRGGPAVPAGSPTTAPVAVVNSPARLTHHLRLVDEATPTRRARPAGVLGAEVWVKLVDAGTGHQGSGIGEGNGVGASSGLMPDAYSQVPGFSFLTLTTRPSFRAEFKAGDGGKTAVYMTRWVNTRGEKGPWSEIATATVAA